MTDRIDYGKLMHKAMRGLVAEVLGQVAEQGLPGNHHFFISFATNHPGVVMPAHLRARYPGDMTIVLQNWFENLAVSDDRFSVTLSFNGNPETLVVPFDALKTFVDPSIEFGLRFDAHDGEEAGDEAPFTEEEGGDDPEPGGAGAIVSLDKFRKR